MLKNWKKKFKIVEKCLKNVEKVSNVMKNEMFDQSLIKTLKTIKCLTRVVSKHSKQSTVVLSCGSERKKDHGI